MIRVQGLKKTYRDGDHRTVILNDLDLSIESGAFVALVGRSGSGKSTLLNCLAGIETPDAGSIQLGDQEIVGMNDDERTLLRRDRLGFVFQFFNLIPILTVRENVALPALLQGRPRGEVLRRADLLLEELELGNRGDEYPDHLSGGEQQRVATARALINDPLVLLADEPTGNLDAQTALATLKVLREVNEKHGVTVVMATHSREAAKAARQVATLEDGKIHLAAVAAGPVDDPDPPAPIADENPTPVVEEPENEDGTDEESSVPVAADVAPAVAAPEAIPPEQLADLQAEAAAEEPVENHA
ncbi:MAG: ABC transporter ATP-binding protein, partial [Gemmatimonadetes bacterium]|nr:ABC transporter ATP-binding protein [Gemmatimonadota bacterium]